MTSIRRGARAAVAAVLLAACAAKGPVTQPPPPARVEPPPPETSLIVVPIRADLTQLAGEVDTRVQSRVSGTHRQNGIDVRYEVVRDPIRISMVGAGLHSSTTIRYSVEACRGRFPCLGCGRREPPREAEITLHTALQWDASWRLRSTTRVLPVHYPRRCEVTWFDFDVTDRFIAPVIREQLETAAALIDRELPRLSDLRPTASRVWQLLQSPSEVAPRTWLVLEPTSVALSPIRGGGSTADTTLQLTAFTRVILGDRPRPAARPLPPLRAQPVSAPADGLRIPFDLLLSYDEASRIATRDFGGRTYKVNGRDLRIDDLRLGPGPGGKVQLVATIDYRGGILRNYTGPVVLEGTPRFDAVSGTMIVPDLDYTLDARRSNAFTRAVERAAHENVRDSLRASARFAVAPQLAAARAGINAALNRTLAPGVELRGTIRSIAPVSVTPLPGEVAIRLLAAGTAEVRTR